MLACVALTLSACTPRGGGAAGATFRFAVNSEPESLDPSLYESVSAAHILRNTFEGLLALDPVSMQPRPRAAQSYSVSADGLHYKFTLREGLAFSDGRPIDAATFVYSFRRLLDPRLGSSYAFLLFSVVGARDFYTRRVTDPGAIAVRAPDLRTLEIDLAAPVPYFPQVLADPHLSALPRHAIEAHGERWTRPENAVSNGPFVLAEWKPHEVVALKRNERWREAARVRLARVEIYPLESTQTMINYYLAGKLDWVVSLPLDRIDELSQRPDYRQSPYLGVYAFIVNTRRPYLSDRRARRALNLAIDKESIAEHVVKAGKIAAWSWVPSFMPDYKPPARDRFDPGQARELLASLGYGKGKPFPKISLHFNTLEGNRQIAEVVQQMLKSNLGVESTLEHQEWKVYLQRQQAGEYDLSRSSWEADYPDPSNFLELFERGNSWNATGFASAAYDDLLRGATAARGAERAVLLARAEELLLREVPVIPLYFYSRTALLSPRVRGFADNVLDQHSFEDLWLEDADR